MNSLTAIAVAQSVMGNLALDKFYLAFATALALATAASTLARDIHRGAAEHEFARWYRAPNNAGETSSLASGTEAERMRAG